MACFETLTTGAQEKKVLRNGILYFVVNYCLIRTHQDIGLNSKWWQLIG